MHKFQNNYRITGLSLNWPYRYIVLVWDEMKVKEDLVFNKHTCELVGFTGVGDITQQERPQCTRVSQFGNYGVSQQFPSLEMNQVSK